MAYREDHSCCVLLVYIRVEIAVCSMSIKCLVLYDTGLPKSLLYMLILLEEK